MKKRSIFFALLLAAVAGAVLYNSFAQKDRSGEISQAVRPFGASTSTVVYGLIKENAVLLSSEFSPVTSLPATYFVVINDETTAHYSVTYLDLSGLVEKARIEKVDYEPKTKFAAAYFTADNDTHTVNVRSAPSGSASVIAALPDGAKAFMYGAVTGDALISAAGNKWHYVRYNDGVNRYGYVYSAQGSADSFSANVIEKVLPPPDETPTETPGTGGGGGGFDWLYILLLCIPAVIIMLALFSRPKKNEN